LSISKNIDEQMDLISSGAVEVIPTDEMRAKVERSIGSGKPLVIKLGVDPTSPDLHIGHAVPLNKLRHFQELGHQVVLLIGDFTALIGDPTEQETTRPVLTPEQVDANARTYIEQAGKIIDTSKARLARNSEWLAPLKFRDILSLTSKFTVARVMERDDFSRRLSEEKPLGLHEFLYPVMQAYDSVALEADVEIGGTDQKFNLLAGRNLQRSLGQEAQCVLTLPLLEGTDGVQKMSKSLGNDVGLTDPPDDMFGKIMSIPDPMIWKYFSLVTQVPPGEVEGMKEEVLSCGTNPRDAKERLAWEVTEVYWGREDADRARDRFRSVFSRREMPEEAEVALLSESSLKDGRIWVVELLLQLEMAPSKAEARRLIEGGGVSIDGVKVTDVELELAPVEIDGKLVRKGRKQFKTVKLPPG
jgi:tyrosyl-tRNA synthetase